MNVARFLLLAVPLVAFVGCATDPAPSGASSSADTTLVCEYSSTRARPQASGQASVVGADGAAHSLYWTKLAATSAPGAPARGTLFYLAGGPISHMLYTDMAAAFQRLAYPDYDVVLYDYYGFNCSEPIQDMATLATRWVDVTPGAMASDFIQLKRSLIGEQNALLMGGSHGSMLGAQIVHDYPAEIERAILFSGDTQTGWLADGWYRFDRLMTKLDAEHPGFADNLGKLLAMAEAGTLQATIDGHAATVDRATLEVALWMSFSLDSAGQASLPDAVAGALAGTTDWIASIVSAMTGLLAPIAVEPPPTETSAVTTFHRCNVWFPKSQRVATPTAPAESFFHFASFVDYWNRLCKDYDAFGEHPEAATPSTPTAVPILSWVGDQDTFDPVASQARWAALSSKLSFQVMPGWSHDFGTDPNAGFLQASDMVKAFLADPH
jgi:pimeloyl-ACP methyl ester carboxylesterase